MFITGVLTPVISCSAVSTKPAKYLSPVSLTPVNNLYLPGVVDTVQKKTKKPKIYRRTTPPKNCSTVSTTPLMNFSGVSATPAIRESCQY
jgi:hypothetical protein